MAATPVKIVFNSYLLLSKQEKDELFKLIQCDFSKERYKNIISGIRVEHMTKEEEKLCNFGLDLRRNMPYLKP